jgi:hypothetical protein
LRTAILIPRAEILLQNQNRSLQNTMNLQWPENFACKNNDVRRERAQITININEQWRRCRRGGHRGRPAATQARAPTTRAFTPVFDGLWGAPMVERPSGSRWPHQAKVATLVILLVDAEKKKSPARVPVRGTLREFEFPE